MAIEAPAVSVPRTAFEAMRFADGVQGAAGHAVADPAVRAHIESVLDGTESRKDALARIDRIIRSRHSRA